MRDSERSTRPLAIRLRQTMTRAEVLIWSRLRRGAITGARFRRQHPVGRYVVDFACIAQRLAIEIDGATHHTDEQLRHDRLRTAFLNRLGWRVLRVTNDDVISNLDGVLETIARATGPHEPPG